MGVPKILILGIGNPLLGDDGFGVEVARRLKDGHELPAVEVVDGGASGLYLLPCLQERSHVLVVDAINFGGVPGQIVELGFDEVPAFVGLKLSEHQVTFHDVLALMELIGIRPREFRFVGVQPSSSRWGDPLSPAVALAVEPAIERVNRRITTWLSCTA